MMPRFFGAPDQLFGAYHPPEAGPFRDTAVLLCYPGHQEYRLIHRAFRRLAEMLAAQGFHVLRFDYSSFGDSAGDTEQADLGRWVADACLAAEELRELSGVPHLSLVGMRLGAIVAARASRAGLRVHDLVLWEPVVDGRDYLRQLDEAQRRAIAEFPFPHDQARADDELLGFSMTPHFREQIAAERLGDEPLGSVGRALIVASSDDPSHAQLPGRPGFRGIPTEYRAVDDPVLDLRTDILHAREALNVIAFHLAGVE